MESFEELKLSKELLEDLKANNITKPTLVQEKTIPLALKGKDLLVQSQTGSGKTLCFALPSINSIEKGKGIQALVIAPTRELAKQVAEEYEKFSKSKKLGISIVYGGVSINNQILSVVKSEVVVGTPGRLLDLIGRNALNISKCKTLVIDEADKLLEMGFVEDIDKIIRQMPKERQTLMFSATINSQINKIAAKYLNNPEKIQLENIIKGVLLKQLYYDVPSRDKISLLVHLMKKERGLCLIFANTKHQTRFLSSVLKKYGIKGCDCINGDLSQNARERILKNFSEGRIDALVATDVAARGIHVDNITHVINYDLPDDCETYIHRIGRTARSGKKGIAITILSDKDYMKMDRIKKELKQEVTLKEEQFERIKIPDSLKKPRSSPFRGGSQGGRGQGFSERRNAGFSGNRGNDDSRSGPFRHKRNPNRRR